MLTNSKWQRIQKWLNFSILNSLSPWERVRERAKHEQASQFRGQNPRYDCPHFWLLCHLEFPCQPIPSPRGRGLGRGQSTNRKVNSAGKAHATAVVIKPALPVFQTTSPAAKENRKEAAWAMPTTTRLQTQQGRLKAQYQ